MSVASVFAAGCEALAASRFAEACRRFREALAEDDQVPEVWNNLGIALFEVGERRDALAAFERAVLLDSSFSRGWSNLGRSLSVVGRLEEALGACRRAIEADPLCAEAFGNAGTILMSLERYGEALRHFRRACELDRDLIIAWTGAGEAQRELGRLTAAEAAYRSALRLAPEYPRALVGLAAVHQQRAETEQALALLRRAAQVAVGDPEIHSSLIMTLNYSLGTDQAALAAESRLYGALQGGGAPAPRGEERFLGRRVRIGYLSADLYRHPVGTFLKQALKNHDRTGFEITCYQSSTRSDQMTTELKGFADRWFCIAGMSDAEAYDLIRANQIDILVDLSGHSAGNRLPLFARRPAPIQATWLGYCHTTGLSAMDYLISDPVTVPSGEEGYYSERVLRLPHSRFCYMPPSPSPFVDELPAAASGFITFGSFNNLAKLTPEVVALWARVLREVPDARLVLKWGSFRSAAVGSRIRARFAELGVAPERIECRASSSHFLALAEYNDIDIALDPFPFTGGLTSCEALWMGVPVVTLAGQSPIGRQSAGFLRTLGLPELIATDEDGYVAIAAALAADRGRLAALREGLRQRLEASPLCDGPGFARALEELFRVMLREKSAGGEDASAVPPVAERSAPLPRPGDAEPLPVPVPRRRLRIAYHLGTRLGAETLAYLRLAELHDPFEFDVLLYREGTAPEEASLFPSRALAGLDLPLIQRLLERDGIDIVVEVADGAPLLPGSVPVRLLPDDLKKALTPHAEADPAGEPVRQAISLERLYRERWLAWFAAQPKPPRKRQPAGIRRLVEEGRALWIAGALEEAEARLTQAATIYPGSADALANLGAVFLYQRRVAEALACFRRALVCDPRHLKARSSLLFALNYAEGSSSPEICAESRTAARMLRVSPGRVSFTNAPGPERPLRIGYLSPDLRRHSVSSFFEPLLAHHDRDRYETVCYSCVEHVDETTSRLRGLAAVWRDCAALDDAQIAALVREDRIDILVDLAGHSGARIRLPVFAARPAPVQVSWLGYPNTTGLSAIDYRLTDPWADPEGEETWYAERLVRLPEGFLCYRAPEEAPAPAPPPAATNGFVTFGSFNMLPKLSDATLALWARLLAAIPESRLILKSHPLADALTRQRLARALRRLGVAEERVRLVPVLPAAEHLALYHEVDIALDPFPYNGTTTTCEALWMGVPVVTLCGSRHAARVGNSLLRRLALDELVASHEEEYLAVATGLARDHQRLAAYRQRLRPLMAASPLCDGAAFARQVERAYREMWRDWCARKHAANQGETA